MGFTGNMGMPLSNRQIDLYSRQILVPEIGGRGQELLLRSSVAWCGTSTAARTALSYLERAGIGHIAEFSPATASTPDLVLTDCDAWIDQRRSHLSAADSRQPLLIAHCDSTTAWYSCATSAADCAQCIAATVAVTAVTADRSARPLATDSILGAALALQAIRELLAIEPAVGRGAPRVVELYHGGTERRIHPLGTPASRRCTHGEH